MNINDIKELRNRTQTSYAECKKALKECGNIDDAEQFLINKGLKLLDRTIDNTKAGMVHSYIHPGNQVGVLVEVHCKTDFVAKTEEFQLFVKELALQIASMKPKYLSKNDIPVGDEAKEYYKRRDVCDDVNMEDWYKEVCLLEQSYVRDGSKKIKELLAELINKVNEPCNIKRFVRWEIGDDSK